MSMGISAIRFRSSGEPSKYLAAPEREQELRDAFASLGSKANTQLWAVWLKDKGCRIVCMSEYSIESEVLEFVKPQAPENIAGIVPQESLFAADEDTCRAAEAAGFRTLPSPDINHLRKALSRMLVKVDVHD